MTREEMNRKLKLYNGIGVETTDNKNEKHFYFYEDFEYSECGIDRAMKQMYDALGKNRIKAVKFIAKWE